MTIHVQVDNKVVLAYLLKMGGTRSSQLLKISKSIWNYLLSGQITTNAEYLPSRLTEQTGSPGLQQIDQIDRLCH